MSEYTQNLGLFKYNTETDGKETFSIEQALNANWDILDNVILTASGGLGESGYVELSDGLLINYGKVYTGSQEVSFVNPRLSSNGIMGGNSFAVAADSANSSSYSAWKVFDGTTTGSWTSGNGGYPHWFTFYNPTPLKVSTLAVTNRSSGNNYAMKDYTVEGSNTNTDGSWVTLKTGENDVATSNLTWYINVNSSAFYKYHRISATSHLSGSGNYIQIGELNITATYITTALNSVIFPKAFQTTNYAYSLAYLNGITGDSYATTMTTTGLTLQNNTNAEAVYYIAIGY